MDEIKTSYLDISQRGITTENLAKFKGVDRQLLIEVEPSGSMRPILMDGKTLGGKDKLVLKSEFDAIKDNIASTESFVDKTSAQEISGLKTFTTLPQSSVDPTNDSDLVTKKYADKDATNTQKGIVQLTSTIDDSEDKAITPKAVNEVKTIADTAQSTADTAKSTAETANSIANANSISIGDLESLETTNKDNLVNAVNELKDTTDNNKTSIGTLSSLETTEKTNLVGAINEVRLNTLKPINEDMSFYVSNVGDDEIADGSQSRPFRTLQGCYDYIRANYYFCKIGCGATIYFLTDYSDDKDEFYVKPVSNTANSKINYIRLGLNNKNVTIKTIHNEDCKILVSGAGTFTLDPVLNKTPIQSINYGSVIIQSPTVFKLKSKHPYLVIANSFCNIEFDDNVTLNFEEECSLTAFFYSQRYSRLRFSKPITITGNNVTTNIGTIQANAYSSVFFNASCTFNNSIQITGKRFDLSLIALVYTTYRGNEFMPGSEDGVKDESSIIK